MTREQILEDIMKNIFKLSKGAMMYVDGYVAGVISEKTDEKKDKE